MRRLLLLTVAAIATFAFLSLPAGDQASANHGPINFTRGNVAGGGFTTANPTTLAYGPDGRLYVADQWGRIQALTLNPTTKQVTSIEQYAPNAELQEVFGIAFDPSDASSPPDVYVTNTVSGFGAPDTEPSTAPPFAGMVTKIEGGSHVRTDIITGLPVSNSGHQANALAFDPVVPGRLYIAQGSTTNAGVTDTISGLFTREEAPLSGAILVADIAAPGFDGNVTYDSSVYSETLNKTGGDVSVYAPGFRNPYDILFHSNGYLYNTDNGPNDGYGPGSLDCDNPMGSDAAGPDELNLIEPGSYYGHANRNRGRFAPDQCLYHPSSDPSAGNYRAPLTTIPSSSNGLAEYGSAAGVFNSQMEGDLLYVDWNNGTMHRVQLAGDGQSVLSDTTLATDLPGALDVTVGTDGTIYVANYFANSITFFKPDMTPATAVSIDAVAPTGGPTAGGANVTVTGTNFVVGETEVLFGATPLANMVVQNSTTITGTTLPHAVGPVNVTVNVGPPGAPVFTDMLPNGYSYFTGGGTTPPVANAGPDIVTPVAHIDHAHVTLDGSASTDDQFITSWVWTLGGSQIATGQITSVQLTEGTHLVTLTVTDNDNNTDTDDVRIIVTATPLNPDPYYCFDTDGDADVDGTDVTNVAGDFNKRYGTSGYSRLRDWNGDRVVNSADVMGTKADLTVACAIVDQQIRDAVVGTEQFQDINAALAAGYTQVTQYIAGMGRHLVKGYPSGLDGNFIPSEPEGLLYEPEGSAWRLAGLMYVIPQEATSIPPPGFATSDDPWHYHENLCFFLSGSPPQYVVTSGLTQAQCLSLPGGIFQAKTAWLLHLWDYHVNPDGRFVEINDDLDAPPASSGATIVIDADPGTAGVQTSRSVSASSLTVDVLASGLSDIGAFNFDLVYNPAVFSAPTIAAGASTDRNPDAEQSFLDGSGRTFTCTPPDPQGNAVSGSSVAARIACTSTGASAGPTTTGQTKIATVTLNRIGAAPAGSALSLTNVNFFNSASTSEIASCAPVVTMSASCAGATISTAFGTDSDSDACPDANEQGTNPMQGGDRNYQYSWDFFDVPVPALTAAAPGGTRSLTVGLSDVLAILYYTGTVNNGGPNVAGVDYDSDYNTNGVEDGIEYDRQPSTTPGKPWRSTIANGSVSIADALVAIAQVGHNCLLPP